MSANRPPATISFNAGDRLFLIPETEDLNGVHFPMSMVFVIPLRRAVSKEAVVEALAAVEQRYPQLRLGYRIDPTRDRLVRVPDADLSAHLAALVSVTDFVGPAQELLGRMASENNTPLSQTVNIVIQGQSLFFRVQHSVGDGRFVMQLISYVLMALLTPERFRQLPARQFHYGLLIWQVVYQSPRQALRVFGRWLKSLRGSVQEYQRDMAATATSSLEPIRSGSQMSIVFKTLSPQLVAQLSALRAKLSTEEKISLNTLLQVLVAQTLHTLGFVKPPMIYTTPIDLHRYVAKEGEFYPGNLIGQVRTTGLPTFDLRTEAARLQKHVRDNHDLVSALSTIPSEWLLMLAGRKVYKRVNRGWLNTSINTDPRFYILSNLGPVDEVFKEVMTEIEPAGVNGTVSLMGGPHLVVGILILQGQGNMSFTYDPRVLSPDQIDAIFEGFTHAVAD